MRELLRVFFLILLAAGFVLSFLDFSVSELAPLKALLQ